MTITLEKRIDDIINNTEWLFFQNIDLIGKYVEKISRLENNENAIYFQNEIERYNNIIKDLKIENEEYLKELDNLKILKLEASLKIS